MRTSNSHSSRLSTLTALLLAATTPAGVCLLAACETPVSSAGAETTGALGMQLTVPDGSGISSFAYTIAGGPTPKSGTIDVSKSNTVSAIVGGLAAGSGYTISITGTSDAGDACAGSAGPFTVTANHTVSISLVVACHAPTANGGVSIHGTIDACPEVSSVDAVPSEVTVGSDVAIAAVAGPDESDAGHPLVYAWTGVTSSDTKGHATFHCSTPGSFPISVTVDNGDPACGSASDPAATASVTVTCDPSVNSVSTPFVWVGSDGAVGGQLAQVSTDNGGVTTFAPGPGLAAAVDPSGNVWISDAWSFALHEVSPSGAVTTYAMPGGEPLGLAADAAGNLYLGEGSGGGVVRKVDGATGAILWTSPPVCSPPVGADEWGVALDGSGAVWVTCSGANTVSKINTADGTLVGTYGVGADPGGVAVDASGNVWVANQATFPNSGVASITKLDGATGATIGTYPVATNPSAVAIDASGNVWVSGCSVPTNSNDRILELSGADGSLLATFDVSTPYTATNMAGIALDGAGHVWAVAHDATDVKTDMLVELDVADASLVRTVDTGVHTSGWIGDFTGFALQQFVMKR